MDRTTLQSILTSAQARLVADREQALAEAGLPSGLAYLALPLLQRFAAEDDLDDVVVQLNQWVGQGHRKELRRLLGGDIVAALRALDGASPLAAACTALVDAIAAPDQREALGIQMQITASDSSSVQQVRQIVVQSGGTYNEAAPDPALAHQQRALSDYLGSLLHECRPLQLSRIDAAESRYQQPMRLERVYIGLHTEFLVKMTEAEQAEHKKQTGKGGNARPLSALEALSRSSSERLMLLGGPGSGKSTFVNHLALCLAEARAAEQQPPVEQQADSWLERLPRWTLGALLPVRVILRDLAAFPKLARAKKGSLKLLMSFLEEVLGAQTEALEPLRAALSEGRALLLFDGLDEVVGDAVLKRVTETISAAAGTYRRSPVLVTCRVLDYRANPLRHIPGFTVETLAPFNEEQIRQFVDAWYAELAATGRQMLGQAAALQEAIQQRPELRALAGMPLLLTMMGIVHAGKGTLPDARALLYAECVDLLLLRWRQEPDQPDVLAQLDLPQFRAGDLLRLMARIGFAAHEQAARSPDDVERPADLDRAQVQRIIEQAFAPYASDPIRRDGLVSRLLHAIATRNGLLLKRSGEMGEVYAFPHRSFQEFLAGYHLSSQDDYDRLCLERAAQIHWHEALRLMASYQVLVQDRRGQPIQLARELLERGPLEQALAGELLNLVEWARAADYRPDLVAANGLWPRAQQTLQRLVTTGEPPDAPAALRVRAGLALGTLCYGTIQTLSQPGAIAPLPDPRLLDPQRGDSSDGRYWCHVEKGSFWYGDDSEGDDEAQENSEVDEGDEGDEQTQREDEEEKTSKLQLVHIDYSFQIARYPVTNAEYARFMADCGYNERRWWTEYGWQQREQGDWTEPRYWDDAEDNNPLQPVVGLSWYEAAAYCIWLTEQGHTEGWLSADDVIRLPTSLEWERAARHTDQRRYPWGTDDLTPEHANYDETEINQPSPVGCFPRGSAVCGAEDMLGNVDEWMATHYETPMEKEPRKDFTTGDGVIISWADWADNKEQMFCGARSWNYPVSGDYDRGFRIMWSRARIV